MSKTRNQRKRERLGDIINGIVAFAVFFIVTLFLLGMACKAWVECPAEQPITYAEHIARFGGADHALQNR